MYKKCKWLTAVVIICIALSPLAAYGSNPSARTITVFRVEGDNALISRGDARSTAPRENQRISEGHILSTGADTTVHLQMDRDSLLQMDAHSQVAVSSSGNRLALSLQSGNALVNAGRQQSGQTLETRVGNVGLTVRGTMFTLVTGGEEDLFIVMLSGAGEVNGTPLPAGARLSVLDDNYTSHTFDIEFELDLETLDLFTLASILEHKDYLIEAGTFTADELSALPEIIEKRTYEVSLAIETAEAEEGLAAEEETEQIIIHVPGPDTTTPPGGELGIGDNNTNNSGNNNNNNNSGGNGSDGSGSISNGGSDGNDGSGDGSDSGDSNSGGGQPPTPPSPPDNIRDFIGYVGEEFEIGEIVRHNGNLYEVLQSFTFNGDPNWYPGIAPSLWKLLG